MFKHKLVQLSRATDDLLGQTRAAARSLVDQGCLVPGLPVYGLTLPRVDQLLRLLLSRFVARCEETYLPDRVT